MFQRRSLRTAPRVSSLAVGGVLAALAVVGGGAVVAVSPVDGVASGDVRLVQNAEATEMAVGTPVSIDLEPIVAGAAGGTVPAGTTVTVTGLPDGLTQNGWVISGTPTRAGTYDVLVTVSNGGVTESETVTVTVTDGAGASPAADAAPGGTTGGDGTTTRAAEGTGTAEGGAGTTDDGTTGGGTTGDGTTGDGTAEGGTTDGTGDGTSPGTTAPDLCAALGDGEVDGEALAAGLAPLLGGAGESIPAGFVAVIVDALARMLPSVLGDTGSLSQVICTLQPLLSGSGAEAGAGDGTTAGGTTTGGTTAGGTTTGGTTTGGTTAGGATGLPAVLTGLLGGGTGSLGG
jgi:hypothetical protein